MSPNQKLIGLFIIWGSLAFIMIFGNALAISVTIVGMVVPIVLIIAASSCSKHLLKKSADERS